MRHWVIVGLLLGLGACEEATPLPKGRCQIHGVVTYEGAPVESTIVATRYAGLHAIQRLPPARKNAAIPDRTTPVKTKSDKRGRYLLTNLPPGVYALSASDAHGHAADKAVILYEDGMWGERHLALVPSIVHTGRVAWRDEARVAGSITASLRRGKSRGGSGPHNPWWFYDDDPPDGPDIVVPLDENGGFRLGPVPTSATFLLMCDLGDGLTWHTYAGPRQGPIPRLQAPTDVSRGRVVTKDGQGIAGAEVRIGFSRFQRTTKTDDAGAFEAKVYPKCRIDVRAPGFQSSRLRVSFTKEPVSITLQASSPLQGQVVQADGRAAPGAHVIAMRGNSWFGLIEASQVVADAEGRFVLERPSDKLNVAFVRGGGWISKGLSDASFRSGSTYRIPDFLDGWKLVVERSGTLRGRVVGADGKPLAGMQVYALATTRVRTRELPGVACGPAVVTTKADGSFTIAETVPGWVYEVLVTRPDLPDVSAGPFPIGSPLEPFEIRVPNAHWMEVRVLDDATGGPIEDAFVSIHTSKPRWAGRPRMANTDARGRARFGPLGPGSCTIRAQHEGYVNDGRQLTVTPSRDPLKPAIAEVRLVKGLSISGVVRGVSDPKQRRVYLKALRMGEGKQRTHCGATIAEEDGRFELDGLTAGRYEIEVTSGSHRVRKSVEAEAGAKDIEIVLEPRIQPSFPTLRVEVVDPQGASVPRARVRVLAKRASVEHPLREGVATFKLDPEQFGEASPLQIAVTSAKDEKGKPLPLGLALHGPVSRTAGTVRVQLKAEQTIEGVARDDRGKPVAGARVSSTLVDKQRSRGLRASSAMTDDAGRFVMGQLGAGRYRLRIRATGDFLEAKPTEAEAGAKNVRLTLERGARVVLTVVDAAGQPISRARVLAGERRTRRGRTSTARTVHTRTIADGTAELRALRMDALYHLEVFPPDPRRDMRPFQVEDWSPATMTIRLERGLTVAGEVRDANGNLVDGARVYIRQGNLSTGVTAKEGRFHPDQLPMDRTVLRAWWPTNRNMWDDRRLPEVVVDDSRLDIVFTLPKREKEENEKEENEKEEK